MAVNVKRHLELLQGPSSGYSPAPAAAASSISASCWQRTYGMPYGLHYTTSKGGP